MFKFATEFFELCILGGNQVVFGRSHYVASHGQESCWGECGSSPAGVVFSDIYTSATRTVTINGDASKVADGPFYRNSRTRMRDISWPFNARVITT